MNTFNIKDNASLRDWLVRSLLVIVTVTAVIWSMPRDSRSYFHVEQGKPWKYADFTAPFDFPVYKSSAVIREERDSVMRLYEPYYKYNKETEIQMVRKFATDYADGIPGLSPDFISIITNRLHSIYQQGVIDAKEFDELHADTTQMLRVVNGKQAVSVSIHEVYSPKSAYEKLFHEEKLAEHRAVLQ